MGANTWQRLHNGFSPKSNFSLVRHFLEMLYATYSLEFPLLGEVSQKSIRGIRDILQVLQKEFKLCMHWRLDLIQTNFLLFGRFRKGFITHSFCKWPLYTRKPLNASTLVRFQNTWKRMNQGKTQCWALFVISKATFSETASKKIRR